MKDRFKFDTQSLQSWQIGPLAPYLAGLAGLICQQGYCRENGWQKIRLIAEFSRWMQRRHLAPKQLNEQQVADFFRIRWKRMRYHSGEQATMTFVLRHLRESKVISPARPPVSRNDIDLIEQEYEGFLLHERSLKRSSVDQYLPVAHRFLMHRFPGGKVRLKKLQGGDVTGFMLSDSSRRGRKSAQLTAAVLRSFFGFLFQRGQIPTNLAAVVPMMAGWRLSELPRFLEPHQIEKMLRCCDRRRNVGKRDYAILLLLARLGLRAGEVANLTLEDLDWRASELLIRGKGARIDKMPMLQDVGQALVDYLHNGRPECSCRRVFLQSKAPYVGFSNPPSAVCGIVRRALDRAQIDSRHHGAHVLRHSLATRMLAKGASLAQIGQVLRHQLPQTTEIYAKVDLKALRALALPWQGGAQ